MGTPPQERGLGRGLGPSKKKMNFALDYGVSFLLVLLPENTFNFYLKWCFGGHVMCTLGEVTNEVILKESWC